MYELKFTFTTILMKPHVISGTYSFTVLKFKHTKKTLQIVI